LRRRDLLIAFGGATGCTLSTQAQDSVPLIGYLNRRTSQSDAPFIAAFRRGLADQHLIEGKTIRIEYRWADNDESRVPSLARDLISRKPALIVTGGGSTVALALKTLTSSIPIVFITGADPIRAGLVKSLGRPEGNVTGVAFWATQIVAKRLELLREFVPKARAIGVLVNLTNPEYDAMSRDLEQARQTVQLPLNIFKAANDQEIEAAFAGMAAQNVNALLIGGDNYFNSVRRKLVALSLRNSLPSMFDFREFAVEGGLMSYGASQTDAYRQSAAYVGRVLGGTRPSDLPVTQSTQFELIINRTTAKALGLEIPTKLMALADEVIE
jgi:putative ABC transport system substrate-binding protein